MRKTLAFAAALLGLGFLLPACHGAYHHGHRQGQHHVRYRNDEPRDPGQHRPHGRYRHRHHPSRCGS